MDNPSAPKKAFRVSREEMLRMMDFLGASTFLGLDLPGAEGQPDLQREKSDQKKIDGSLQKKGILRSEGKQAFAVDPQIRPILEALFFPKNVLLVVRDQSGSGRRTFQILRKGKMIVLHSVPKKREHFIRVLAQPADVLQLIVDWFPMYPLPVSPAKFRMDKTLFEKIRALAEGGQKDETPETSAFKTQDPVEWKNLLRAIKDRKVSGSLACLNIQSNKVEGGDSIAVLTDGRTGWLIFEEDSNAAEAGQITVRRIGGDFGMVMRRLVEQLTGTSLPRKQTDPSGRWIRFPLSANELAVALGAINCVDLSKKIYAGFSRDYDGGQYAECMKAAQKSLVDAGLCTVSASGLPKLIDDLAQAVFPIAQSDLLIQVTGSPGGTLVEKGIYIVRGRFFTVYSNYGEQLQLLEYGKYKDLPAQMESMFPDFGTEKGIQKKTFPVSYAALEEALGKSADRQAAIKILTSNDVSDSNAKLLSEDLADISFRASLIRRDAPEKKKAAEEQKDENRPNTLLLLKSPRRSWMFQFPKNGGGGTAAATDRAGFVKALSELAG